MRSQATPGEADAGPEVLRGGARVGELVAEARNRGLRASSWGLEKVVRSCSATE